MAKDTENTHIQAFSSLMADFFENVAANLHAEQSVNDGSSSLVLACCLPNVSQSMWQAYLEKNKDKQPLHESFFVIEFDENSFPGLAQYSESLLTQAEDIANSLGNIDHFSTTQVHANEKQFLFFGAIHE